MHKKTREIAELKARRNTTFQNKIHVMCNQQPYSTKPGAKYEFKTHLTNHCLRIRSGEFLLEVVKATVG